MLCVYAVHTISTLAYTTHGFSRHASSRQRTGETPLLQLSWDREEPEEKAAFPPAPAPAPAPSSPPPEPELLTADGTMLAPLLGTPIFGDEWSRVVRNIAAQQVEQSKAAAASGTLQARVSELQDLQRRRHALQECLYLRVQRSLADERMQLLCDATTIGPGQVLPPDAATLVRVQQHFPGQSARQVLAYVSESAPLNDPEVGGRFDRLQAAKLYMGCVQFGYFLSQVFRGQAHLADDAMLAPEEAQAVVMAIQASTRQMKSEAAWAVASRRAGHFFGLPRTAGTHDSDGGELDTESDGPPADDGAGFEGLRTFTTQVQVVGAAQQEEFFASDKPSEEHAASAAASGAGSDESAGMGEEDCGDGQDDITANLPAFPRASFIAFNTAGLQACLAEACIFGWHLWAAEAQAMSTAEAAAPGAAALLMIPPLVLPVEDDDVVSK